MTGMTGAENRAKRKLSKRLRHALAWAAAGALLALVALVAWRFGAGLVLAWPAAGLSVLAFAGVAWNGGLAQAERSSGRRMAEAVSGARDAQLLGDADGRPVLLNPLCGEFLRAVGGDEESGLDGLELLLPSPDGARGLARLKESAAAGRRDTAEVEVGKIPSDTRWWRITVLPTESGPDRVLWLIEDTSPGHRARAEAEARIEIAEDLLGDLPVGLFSADGDGDLVYVNRTLGEWLGIHAGEVEKGRHRFADFVRRPDEGSDFDNRAPVADASGMHGAVTLEGADGAPFEAYLIQSRREDRDGEFIYSRSVVLREPFVPLDADGSGVALVKRYPWLFIDAPIGIVLLDLQANVIECNRAFLKILGLHRDAVAGRPLSDRISLEDRDDAAAQLSKVVMGIAPAALLDVRLLAGADKDVMASCYVSRIRDGEGEISGLVLHVIDTTEQKNLETQFNQSQKMHAVGQLAGGVAHDFNNLLTAMIGFCDLLLQRHTADDPSFADIMQIKQNANRAANLVRQLLAFSRRQTLQPKTIEVADALADMSNLLRRLIGENIELDIGARADGADFIRIDPGQFDQVIINLVVNARDAMPGGGTIIITTEAASFDNSVQKGHEVVPAGDYVLLKVADTGAGIAKEDIGQIFDPFFSTKGVGKGTGLGLSTVYGIVRQSEGFIFVDSAKGEGTTFSIYLPAYGVDESHAAAALNGEEEADLTGRGTVLLVEDEDAVRVFGSRALRNKGYRVLEANDGEDALDVINEFANPIDLIITDVVMPGMDGHTLVRLVQAELPGIKVILMSGYAEEAIPGEIGQDTTIHFLPKPFSLQELAGKVKAVIGS